MLRALASIVGGLFIWVVVVTLLNFVLRAMIPGYHAAEASLEFTLAMKIGRLVIAALASLSGGAAIGLIVPSRKWAPWAGGLMLLLMFLPEHVKIWSRFPPWYHLTFLLTLPPLFAAGWFFATGTRNASISAD